MSKRKLNSEEALNILINDLSRKLQPKVPCFFGEPLLKIKSSLIENKGVIEEWLKTNKKEIMIVVNQL